MYSNAKNSIYTSYILVFCAYLNSIYARPQNSVKSETVASKFELGVLGDYSFSFATSEGIRHEASGELKDIGTPNERIVVKGVYSFFTPDGIEYQVEYTADEKGFIPVIKMFLPTDIRIGDSCRATLCGTGIG